MRWYHGDHLGSASVITDESGELVRRLEYRPYGEESYAEGADSATLPYTFTGQRKDTSTGLMYYNARYYDPELGRFTQPDMIVQAPADPQSLNRYSYVRNNPINFTDPSGQSWLSKAIGAVLGIATTILTGGNVGAGLAVYNLADSTELTPLTGPLESRDFACLVAPS